MSEFGKFRHRDFDASIHRLIVAPKDGKFWTHHPLSGKQFSSENAHALDDQIIGIIGDVYYEEHEAFFSGREIRMARRGYVLRILEESERLVVANQPLFIVRFF